MYSVHVHVLYVYVLCIVFLLHSLLSLPSQLILFLSSCLKGSHGDGETFTFLLKKLVARLQMEEVGVAPMMVRSSQSEVLLLLLRFFNIIMSRKRMKGDKVEVCGCGFNQSETFKCTCYCYIVYEHTSLDPLLGVWVWSCCHAHLQQLYRLRIESA